MNQVPNKERRRVLRRFLSQYYRAKQKQAALRQRLADLELELKNPSFGGGHYGGIPIRGDISAGAAALTYRIADIEARIQDQLETEARCVADIMAMLEHLPQGMERDIIEYRHIDCKAWAQVETLVHMTRTACYKYYNRGLDLLLQDEYVQATLTEFKHRPGVWDGE